jgi:hypothetical protein
MPELKKDPFSKYCLITLYYAGDETTTKDAVPVALGREIEERTYTTSRR